MSDPRARVPRTLRRGNEEGYTPKLISIGPFHHGKPELTDMKEKKKLYMKNFLQREEINEILSFIKDYEKTIRACYAEAFRLQSIEFVMMILYDSIFIIEIFIREQLDVRSDISLVTISLCTDLQLFENQLPYFVLEQIYMLAFTSTDMPFTFKQLSYRFFSAFTCVELTALSLEVKHFTDWKRINLLKSSLETSSLETVSDNKWIHDLPCAVKLHESGVKFKKIHIGGEQSLFDIKFDKRKQLIPFFEVHELQMPQLLVDEGTQRLFENIIALEQCLYPEDTQVCNYVELMTYLINTKEDMDLLVEKEIISNKLGDNVLVANMFNKLNVLQRPSSYYHVYAQLKRHYDNPWNRVKVNLKIGTLKRVYFNNPWRGAATIAAIILLLLTIVQTVCSILQIV
ncbi:UPF0481 protein At3g47200-like [Mangifera indica]|uniref:UPF0481 protein At3g47200-like n=1 Tax=Mangifera indica TaxID=29780 RepID=UPI001CFBAAB1|nr:UPF0481 protein At3g47200-like [Mangifera indica]